tara:strand:- start:122 stop:337 length:216 start_codon:yes stop_codon:yes gene_type:complete
MSSFIDPFYFMVSFYIGLFFVYISYQTPDITMQYPTLENAGKITYKNNDSCYKYKKIEVMCPLDNSVIISK